MQHFKNNLISMNTCNLFYINNHHCPKISTIIPQKLFYLVNKSHVGDDVTLTLVNNIQRGHHILKVMISSHRTEFKTNNVKFSYYTVSYGSMASQIDGQKEGWDIMVP